MNSFGWRRLLSFPLALVLSLGLQAAPAGAVADTEYSVHPLVSNVAGAASHTDSDLVNAWGLTASATSPWWVADNGTSVSRSEEHTSELQSRRDLVCRLLLEKKKRKQKKHLRSNKKKKKKNQKQNTTSK